MKVNEVVDTAIDNLDPGFLKGQWHGCEQEPRNNGIDGEFTLEVDGRKETFDAIVKRI